MVNNPFTFSHAREAGEEEKPAALSAFLSPTSRFLGAGGKSSAPTFKQLTPDEISQKIASLLTPGPPFYSTASSADLIDNISSASIMRCDALQEQAAKLSRQATTASEGPSQWHGVGTVWSSLDALPSGSNRFTAIPHASSNLQVFSAGTLQGNTDDDGLWDSIMLSYDIKTSKVQVNKSVVIPTHVLADNHFYNGNKKSLFTTIGVGEQYKYDDFSSHAKINDYVNLSSYISLLGEYKSPSLEMWTWPSWVPFLGKDDAPATSTPTTPPTNQAPKGSKRIWIPSTTAISVKASWWGFTIYLPKAVFPELEADVQQAEKIANLVNKVLTTMLDHISSLPIPIALQAAVAILKAISPSTAYIATFIGWSWDEIKSFDNGQGVELSATWLLPIA